MDWPAIVAAWDAAWRTLRQAAVAQWGAQIQANPTAFKDQVEGFGADLKAIEGALQRSAIALGRLGWPAEGVKQWEDARRLYVDLAAGLWAESRPVVPDAPGTSIGFVSATVVLVVLGVGVTAVGIAWAVVARPYTESLRRHAETAAAELEARVAASRDGRTLQASTLPGQGTGSGSGSVPLGGQSIGGIIGIAASLAFVGGLGWLVWNDR